MRHACWHRSCDKAATFKEFTEIAGLPAIMKLEEKYGVPEDQRASL
ncbi:MAG TPA: hypothetical protein VGP15_08540 [Burkholderiales bacterium]|nr:hypothetical protein [Burkholderiales bacterium]